MQVATAPSFTERLCAAYDFNRGFAPADGVERVRRSEIVEYINAYTVEKPPSHPTTAIAWDLQRTFGESEGRRLLLYASRRWDAKPLRAREIVHKWWEDGYEPRAWVDEYLLDVIRDWRLERDRQREKAKREAEKAEADARIERLKERIAVLTKAYEEGWPKYEKFTKEESSAWCEMYMSMRFNAIFIDTTEAIIEYFEAKLYRLYQRYVEARNANLGLNLKPKVRLGPTLLGRKGRR